MKEQVLKYFNQLLSEVSDSEKEQLDWGLAKIFPKDDSAKVNYNIGWGYNEEIKKVNCSVNIFVKPLLFSKTLEAEVIQIENEFIHVIPNEMNSKFNYLLRNATAEDIESFDEAFSKVLIFKIFPVSLYVSPAVVIAPMHGAFRFSFISDETRKV